MATGYRNAFAAPSGFVTAAPGSQLSAEVADHKGRKGTPKAGAMRASSGHRSVERSGTKAA